MRLLERLLIDPCTLEAMQCTVKFNKLQFLHLNMHLL